MSANGNDREDVVLLGDVLRVLRRIEPVPESVVQQARAAYAWRHLSASIALLEFDSAIDHDDLARVRGQRSDRHLSFRGVDTTVEISVTDGGRRLVGNITPPRVGNIELRHPRGTTSTSIDAHGRFLFDRVPRGSVSLLCTPTEAGSSLETEWVTL